MRPRLWAVGSQPGSKKVSEESEARHLKRCRAFLMRCGFTGQDQVSADVLSFLRRRETVIYT